MGRDELLLAIAAKLGIPVDSLRAATAAKNPTVKEIANGFDEWALQAIESWGARRGMFLLHVLPHFADTHVGDITLVSVDDYRIKRRGEITIRGSAPTPATLNREVDMLHACLAWAHRRKIIDENPLAGWERLPEDGRPDYYLTEDDFGLLLAHTDGLFRLMCIISYDTGMRRDEVRLLTEEEVNLERGVIVLGTRTKTKRGRVIPLTDRALEALQRAMAARLSTSHYVFVSQATGTCLSHHWMQLRMVDAVDAAGLPKYVTFHTLRHSWATRMSTAGMPLQQIMARGGWTSRAAMRYQHLEQSDEAVESAREMMNAKVKADLSRRKGPMRASQEHIEGQKKLTNTSR